MVLTPADGGRRHRRQPLGLPAAAAAAAAGAAALLLAMAAALAPEQLHQLQVLSGRCSAATGTGADCLPWLASSSGGGGGGRAGGGEGGGKAGGAGGSGGSGGSGSFLPHPPESRQLLQGGGTAAQPKPDSAVQAGVTTSSSDKCSFLKLSPTVLLFVGPDLDPYVSEMRKRLPSLPENVVKAGAVTYLNLSDAKEAACAASFTGVSPGGTLVLWEDGNLTQAPASVLNAISSWTAAAGRIIVYGKEGRENPGVEDLKPLLGSLQGAGELYLYNLDALTSMKGLDSLKTVTGDLVIGGCDGLVSLQGLAALSSVGKDFILNSNLALPSVDGLQSLQSIGGQLYVKGNGVLMDLSGLKALHTLGSQYLINNGNTQLSLPSDVHVGTSSAPPPPGGSDASAPAGYEGSVLVIFGSGTAPALKDVKAMHTSNVPPVADFVISKSNTRFVSARDPTLRQVANFSGHVIIWDDGTLDSLPDLPSLRGITGQLLLLGAPLKVVKASSSSRYLSNLKGLRWLQSVGGLNIIAHSGLETMEGLSALIAIKGSLVIARCHSLKSLKGLGEDAAAAAALEAAQATLARREPPPRRVLSRIGSSLWLQGNRELSSLEGLDLVEEIFWNVMITYCPKLLSLDGLGSLTSIGGELALIENYALRSLGGMGPVEEIGISVAIMYNPALKDLSGLALTQINGDLVISGNPALQSLQDLGKVTSVRLNLVVSRNNNLTDLNGLGSVRSVGYHLVVADNQMLRSLQGLQALSSIGEDLYIRRNPHLETLAELGPALKTVLGSVYVEGNPKLSSLGQLAAGLEHVSGFIKVLDNPSLPQDQGQALKAKASVTVAGN